MTSTENGAIGITGEPTVNPAACRFTVDRAIYPEKAAYLPDRDAARLAPLALKIFEIPEVENILIAGNQVTVTKSGNDSWRATGKLVGNKIREHIASGQPAVTEEFERTLPPEAEIREKARELLEDKINPMLSMHGGFVKLVDVRRNNIFIQLGGGCRGCASAAFTLKMGIERIIREQIPEAGEVIDSTDHATAGRQD